MKNTAMGLQLSLAFVLSAALTGLVSLMAHSASAGEAKAAQATEASAGSSITRIPVRLFAI